VAVKPGQMPAGQCAERNVSDQQLERSRPAHPFGSLCAVCPTKRMRRKSPKGRFPRSPTEIVVLRRAMQILRRGEGRT